MALAAETTTYVSYGRPATSALLDRIRLAQANDPLARVTVVVPSNLAGLSLRRVLSAGLIADDRGAGLVNVAFSTPYQLAAEIGSARLAGSGLVPVSTPVLAAGARSVLRTNPGYFANVAQHAATELAVVRLYSQLSRVHPRTMQALAASEQSRTQQLIKLFDELRAVLSGFHDEDDLALAAATVLREGGVRPADLGVVVLFLLEELTPSLAEMFEVLGKESVTHTIRGRTGVAAVDEAPNPLSDHLFVAPGPGAVVTPTLPTDIVSVADHDDEVGHALRLVVAEAEAGTPMHRMAVLYPQPTPYARTLHEKFSAAGVPHNGPTSKRLSDSMVGQVLVRLLALSGEDDRPTERLRREAVINLAAAGPLRSVDGAVVAPSLWDMISRKAGVLGGVVDWNEKLDRFREALDERMLSATADGRSEGSVAAMARERNASEELQRFVERLSQQLDPAAIPTSWRERSAWAKKLLGELLPPINRRDSWPAQEIDAAEKTDALLDRLGVLDGLDSDAAFSAFVRAVHHELDTPLGRLGDFGSGVLVAPLSAAPGLDVDVVVILGLAEGVLPTRRNEDSLLPDVERQRAVFGELATRSSKTAAEHRNLLAALGAGRTRRIVLTARGDHRTGRDRQPSRWLLDLATLLIRPTGSRISTGEWPFVEDPRLRRIESFAAGLQHGPVPGSLVERDLAMLEANAAVGLSAADHFLVDLEPDLARSFELQQARAAQQFTKFDGDLRQAPVPSPDDQILSASRLEAWAKCPMRYFLGSVLGLGQIDKPEEIMEISALDRGSLTHEILEEFLTAVVEVPRNERPDPSTAWSGADRDRLFEIADRVCERYEAQGRTGKPLLWRMRRNRLASELDAWLITDNRVRARLGAIPEQVEMQIGFGDEAPVSVRLRDGREVHFRGFADRVDLRESDGSPIVYDYKTGKVPKQRALDEDPVQAGERLQLGLYAAAARQRFESDTAEAHYWSFGEPTDSPLTGYRFTPERENRFRDVVSAIVAGIETGVFPMNPGEYNDFFGKYDECRYCDFDAICPSNRGELAAAIEDDPAIAGHASLGDLPNPDEASDSR